MKSRKNKLAGKHPSYEKAGLSDKAIKNKIEYDKKYHATPERKKYRAELNKANKESGTYGNGDGKDMSHTKKGSLVMERMKANRARNGRGGKPTKK
jgi:hypothetical protein